MPYITLGEVVFTCDAVTQHARRTVDDAYYVWYILNVRVTVENAKALTRYILAQEPVVFIDVLDQAHHVRLIEPVTITTYQGAFLVGMLELREVQE
jgi:hypothetical protein